VCIYNLDGGKTAGGFSMKNKKYLFLGTLIMGMAFVSVLAGCDTGAGPDNNVSRFTIKGGNTC
jgi:hypothetical protein